jgi:Gas vesicle protein G
MIFIDRLLTGGVRWVLTKVVAAFEAELNDDSALQNELLEAQMRLELGEITSEEFDRIQDEVLVRLREIQERRQGGSREPHSFGEGGLTVAGVEADVDLTPFEPPPSAGPPPGPEPSPPRARARRRGRRVRRRG